MKNIFKILLFNLSILSLGTVGAQNLEIRLNNGRVIPAAEIAESSNVLEFDIELRSSEETLLSQVLFSFSYPIDDFGDQDQVLGTDTSFTVVDEAPKFREYGIGAAPVTGAVPPKISFSVSLRRFPNQGIPQIISTSFERLMTCRLKILSDNVSAALLLDALTTEVDPNGSARSLSVLSEPTNFFFPDPNDLSVEESYEETIFSFPDEVSLLPSLTSWDGTSWSDGVPELSDEVIIDGDFNTELNGNIEARRVTINPNATVEINPGNFIDIRGDLINNGTLQVESEGSLVIYGEVDGIGTGSFTRRTTFSTTQGKYSMVTSPVTSSGFDVLGTSAQNWIFWIDETIPGISEQFVRPSSIERTEMGVGIGYFSARTGDEDGNITFTGIPNSGEITVPVVRTDHSADPDNEHLESQEGFNLIGNPYTCAIDANKFFDTNPDVELISIWDHTGTAGYIRISRAGAIEGGSGRVDDWDGHIRSMQGFFIRKSTVGEGEVVFTNDMKVSGSNTDIGFFRHADTPQADIRFTLSSADAFDESLIVIQENTRDIAGQNIEVTHGLATPDAQNRSDLSVYSVGQNRKLSIQTMSSITSTKEVPIGIDVKKSGNYTLDISSSSYDNVSYIIDHDTGIRYKLGDRISFYTESGDHPSRFSLVLDKDQEKIVEPSSHISSGELNISYDLRNEANRTATVQVLNFNGAIVKEFEKVDLSTGSANLAFQKEGLFIVQIVTAQGVFASKVIGR